MKSLDIAIIGAGIAGTAAALLLRRQGHHVTLFERSGRIGPVGAGFLLQPSGQGVLARLGLLEACVARSERIDELHAVTASGRTMSHLRYGDLGEGLHALGVHRANLFDVIHAMLAPAGVDVRLATEVGGYEHEGRGARLQTRDRWPLGRFDLAIVADGARSRLRSRSGLCRHDHEYDHAAVWCVGPCPGVRHRLFQRTFGTRRLCGLLPIGDGLATLFWGIRRDDWLRCRSGSLARWRDEVSAFEPLAEPVVTSLRSFDDLVFTTFRHVEMSAWRDGAVVFVGDAAHATSPHLGQGVNVALTDVETLADALACSASVNVALERYEAARRVVQRYYSTLTRVLTPLFQSDGRVLGAMRDVGLPFMCNWWPTRTLMLHTLAGTWQTTTQRRAPAH